LAAFAFGCAVLVVLPLVVELGAGVAGELSCEGAGDAGELTCGGAGDAGELTCGGAGVDGESTCGGAGDALPQTQ